MSAPKKPCGKHPDTPRDASRACPICKKAQVAAWQRANKERVAAKSKRWRETHIEHARELRRAWEKRNPSSNRMRVALRRARILGVGGKLSTDLFQRLMREQNGRCRYRDSNLMEVKPNLDHIMPLALGGAHDDSNMQLLCETCNRQKRSKHPLAFAQEKGIQGIQVIAG